MFKQVAYHVYRDPMPKKDKITITVAIIAMIVMVLSLFSCIPEQRMAALLKKNPQLLQTKTEYVVKNDTVYSKEIHKDTLINNIFSKDTVFIHENNLLVKYIYKGGDSADITAHVTPQRVIVHDTIKEINQSTITVAGKTGWQQFKDDSLLIVLGAFICVLIYLAIKILKPKL